MFHSGCVHLPDQFAVLVLVALQVVDPVMLAQLGTDESLKQSLYFVVVPQLVGLQVLNDPDGGGCSNAADHV